MAALFDPVTIHGLRLPNRVVRSATYENRCDADGRVTDELLRFYRKLVVNDIGLVITGNAIVHPWGLTAPHVLGIWSDEHLPGLTRLATVFRDAGQAGVVQLSHGGRQTQPKLIDGHDVLAPSAVYSRAMKTTPREMTLAEIREVIDDFVAAAERAQKAGFQGVQLHAAHGYLLSNFLSPCTNRRTDEFGQDTEARTRILLEIHDRIRARCGSEFPVLLKLNAEEGLRTGIDAAEAVRIVQVLDKRDFAAIEVSGGVYETGLATRTKINSKADEAYFLHNAERLHGETEIPLILVGGIRSPERIDEILASGTVALVSMCRPFIREPGLLRRWHGGDRTAARCISCNECVKRIFDGPVRCYQEEKASART